MASASSKTSNGKPVSNIAQCRGVSLGYADSYVQETAAIEGIEQPFRFTGREWDDAAQLYHYRARAYDPSKGRFLQEDPIEFRSGDLNIYRYVGSNPLMYTDPSGENAEYAAGVAVASTFVGGAYAIGQNVNCVLEGLASAFEALTGLQHSVSVDKVEIENCSATVVATDFAIGYGATTVILYSPALSRRAIELCRKYPDQCKQCVATLGSIFVTANMNTTDPDRKNRLPPRRPISGPSQPFDRGSFCG